MRISSLQKFQTQHEDIIHDVAYDYYGKRIATCSSDQKIKVWDLDEPSGNWTCSAEWKAHTGSVWRVVWAHPEFGQVIASCSYDRNVYIWEEEEGPGGKKKWTKKGQLADSRDNVSDIRFAPKYMGLKLATSSYDSYIRIYEATDVMELGHWTLTEEFEALKGGVSCISWNPALFGPPRLIVGGADNTPRIWEYNDTYRKWQVVESLIGHQGHINDVSWAPSMGRSYHLIATGSKDGTVRIWKVQPSSNDKHKLETTCVAVFGDHQAEVWRVDWNITGTVLASSGDDGKVRLWKTNFQGKWKCLSVVSGEEN